MAHPVRIPLFFLLACLVFAGAAFALALASQADAANITVNTTNDELNADGDCSLREAVEAANTDAVVDACTAGSGADTITAPAGTYALTMGQLEITSDITFNGAGPASTIVDGGGSVRPFFINDSSATVAMNDLTVQNGHSGSDGGGIWVSGTLSIDNVVVQDNYADASDGGGIYINWDGTLNATNCQVTGNEAVDGGGIVNEGIDTLNLTGCTVSGNLAHGDGGGIVYRWEANGSIAGSTIAGNTTESDGGGVYIDQCCGANPIAITNSAITGNSALDDGGGISIDVGAATLTNVTLSGNETGDLGGGLRVNDAGTATLTNVTIADNTGGVGGGLAAEGTAVLLNTIVATNALDDCFIDPEVGILTSNGHNVDGDGTCDLRAAGDQPNTDPALAALAPNAPGTTETHALTATSPAVDTADGAGCPAADQRGVTRPQDGNKDGTAACDIGAYELEAAPTPTAGPTPTPTQAPEALPPTGGPDGGGDAIWPWLAALAAGALLAVGGGAMAVRRARV